MIPEVTESQCKLMSEVCLNPNMATFAQCSTNSNDSLPTASLITQAQRDADHLVSLGLLKNITEDHKEQVELHNKQTQRTWRIFEVTPMGRAFFQATTAGSIPS